MFLFVFGFVFFKTIDRLKLIVASSFGGLSTPKHSGAYPRRLRV